MDFPKTIGLIVDGNRRWAKEKNLAKKEGHRLGIDNLVNVLEWLKETNTENIIAYLFSTENWKRDKVEVADLMSLLKNVLANKKLIESGYKIQVIGQRERLPKPLQQAILRVENKTSKYKKIFLVALSYGGRSELVRACNNLIEKGKTNVTEGDIQSELYTRDIPDPDLIIRTGGRYSLSNFLIWQAAYAEIYVTETLWPALTKDELFQIIERFSQATRKMGA